MRKTLFWTLLLLDCLLLLAHLYDPVPTMHTVTNGRVTYVVLTSALLSASYALLHLH